MKLELYRDALATWPTSGRHILASYDDTSIVVYQAYRPSIGLFAAKRGRFGGEFSLSRMSWIKPNFLWMMYRSGWGTKEDQEITLAVRLRREAFDAILAAAVPSSFAPEIHRSEAEWKSAVATSEVRLQWDPDHDPAGTKTERRAIQLGLRGSYLERYASEWIVAIDDVSELVARERENARDFRTKDLRVPAERVYPVADSEVARRLGLSSDAETRV